MNKFRHPKRMQYESLLAKADLIDLITRRGGKLISKYQGAAKKVTVQCAKGHKWEATPNNLKAKVKPSWCPICSKHARLTVQDAKKDVERKGGRLISNEYNGSTSVLTIECDSDEQHIFRTQHKSIRNQNSWCHVCHKYEEELCACHKEII